MVEGIQANVNNYNGPADSNFLFSAFPGTWYRLLRNSKTEEWRYEEVDANEATPYTTSLTYNEFGNHLWQV